jgi:trimethylamine--corrinoid protein Co-methyltransferase
VDQQAALEAALTLITSTLAGAQLIHDVGYMDSGTASSLIQMVICHEIISWIHHYMKGLDINEENLALDLIDEIGTDGSFIDTPHTFKHFKEDEYPELRDHQRFDDWLREGAKTLKDRAKEKVEQILVEQKPPGLEASVQNNVKKIIDSV